MLDTEIKTWAEIGSLTLNQLSHPGAPRCSIFVFGMWQSFRFVSVYQFEHFNGEQWV